MGDKTDTTTPYPCLLSPEEQAKLRFMKVKNNNFKSNELVAAAAPTPVTVTGVMQQIFDLILSADQQFVTISSIPQTFNHLLFTIHARSTQAVTNEGMALQFNGDSGTNYARSQEYNVSAAGLNVVSDAGNTDNAAKFGTVAGASAATASRVGGNVGIILDYTGTTYDKTINVLGGDSGNPTYPLVIAAFSTWLSTAAITSIKFLLPSGNNFKVKSRFSLYGF